jgi:hypothetical protein
VRIDLAKDPTEIETILVVKNDGVTTDQSLLIEGEKGHENDLDANGIKKSAY